MNGLFTFDNKFMILINKLIYASWLNILWFLCCIPIFTIGASTTALYDVSLRLVRNEDGNVTRQFFAAFRRNFKEATKIWLILLLIGIALAVDGYVLFHVRFSNVFWTLCTALCIAAFIVYCVILLNIFPLLARFDNTIRAMFLNALVMGLRYLFCSISMAVIYFAVYYIIINIFTPFAVFGHGFAALLCCWLINPILKKLEASAVSAS